MNSTIFYFFLLIACVSAQFWNTYNYGSYPAYSGYYNNYNPNYNPYNNYNSNNEVYLFARKFGHSDRVGGNAGLQYGCLMGCRNAVFGR